MRWSLGAGGLAAVLAAGCMDNAGETRVDGAFSKSVRVAPRPAFVGTPGSTETCARVDTLGRRLLAANPQLGAQPLFTTIGVTDPEVFHRGVESVYITEGLVRQCTTDGQLAGLLALELAQAVADRELAAPPEVRRPDRQPPIVVDRGSGLGGTTPDQTGLAELARYDADRKRRSNPLPRPDARQLARKYLVNAGFREEDLDAAAPLREAAQAHNTYEKQLLGAAPAQRADANAPAPQSGVPLPAAPAR
jgi:hypothetical protein